MREIVTIDGPSGVGKSTVSRRVALKLGFTYLDTGAMYRGVGLFISDLGLDLSNEKEIEKKLKDLELALLPADSEESDVGVLLNGKDVSSQIRTPEMSMIASKVSALPVVRTHLTTMQQKIGEPGKIVAEGRDMGTVVFPDAAYKFYLDADPRERCNRRVKQIRSKGMEVDEEELYALIVERDTNDSQRAVAPLKKADDAHLIDTTKYSIDEVCQQLFQKINKTLIL